MSRARRAIGFGGLAMAVLCTAASPVAAQSEPVTVTLNPNGGMTAGDGLRIAVSYFAGGGNAFPFLQVHRGGNEWFYYDTEAVEGASRANLGVGPTGSGETVESWSAEGAALSAVVGTGTAADPWRTTLTLRTRADGDVPGFTLAQTFSYVAGEDTLLLALTVTPPSNNTQPVKLYHQTDTNLNGGEEGPAWVRPSTSDPRVVGVARTDEEEAFVGYLEVDSFAHFFAGDFLTDSGIDGAGDLVDEADLEPDSDKLLAVQFDLGVITAPATVRVRLGFRSAPCTAGGGTPAAPDTGCTTGSPACDGNSGVCVPCTGAGFCNDGLACDGGLQRCRICDDNASGAGMDRGCAAAAPICDTSTLLGTCNACADDAAAAGTDSGCSAGAPICAASDGERACAACVDDALLTGRDTGCAAPAPLCDTSGEAPVCAVCVNDVNGAGQDTGCAGATPICASGTGGADAACVACSDDASGEGIDSGCDAAEPLCDTSGESPACIALCSDDQTGAAIDRGCGAAAPVCDTSGASAHCTPCLDDEAGATVDTGCSATAPLCDTSGSAPACVACRDDADGAEDQGCSGSTPVCDAGVCRQCEDSASASGARDFGCAAESPVCDVSGEAPACVDCAEDDDCETGVCNVASHACEVCRDDQSSAMDEGCGAGAPHCDTSGAPSCAACVDDQEGSDTDLGCGGDTPLCETGSGPAHCVACIAAGDDEDGPAPGCDEALPVCTDAGGGARRCVVCADDQASGTQDDGCPVDAPVCDATGAAPVCRTCVDDQSSADEADNGCTDAAPVCDAAADTPRCVACLDDHEGTGVDFGCEGERSFCDTSTGTPACVYCLDTERGARDIGCTGIAPACVVLDALHVCVECEDDQSGDARDFGCGDGAPFCDAENPLAGCMECRDGDDCDGDLRCNAAHQCAKGCGGDDECSGELAACDEDEQVCAVCTRDDASACADSARGRACVGSRCGCIADEDCDPTQVCVRDPGVCVPRSALTSPDAGTPEPSEPGGRDPEPGRDPQDRQGSTPVVSLRGGSNCSVPAPSASGSALPLFALLFAVALHRRSTARRR